MSRELAVDAAQVGDQLGGERVAGGRDRAVGLELVEQTGGLSCADLAGNPPGDSSHSTACSRQASLGAVPGQVTVTFRPHLHHRGVILDAAPPGPWSAARRRPPSGRRWGRSCWSHRWPAAAPGRPASAARRGPARRRRRAAGPAGSRARWRPRPPTSAPGTAAAHSTSRSSCLAPDRTRSSAEDLLAVVERHRGVRPLVRVDPDHHRHRCSFVDRWGRGPWWACLIAARFGAHASFEPDHGETRRWHLVRKPGRARPADGS